MQLFEEGGTDLAQTLTQKEKTAQLKAAMCPEVAKALARLSGENFWQEFASGLDFCVGSLCLCLCLRKYVMG